MKTAKMCLQSFNHRWHIRASAVARATQLGCHMNGTRSAKATVVAGTAQKSIDPGFTTKKGELVGFPTGSPLPTTLRETSCCRNGRLLCWQFCCRLLWSGPNWRGLQLNAQCLGNQF